MTRLLSSFGTGNRYFNTLVTWFSRLAFAIRHIKIPASITYSLTQTGAKVVEDEMRKCFRYCALVLDIVPKNNVVQRKIGCWSVGEMTYDHTIYGMYHINNGHCVLSSFLVYLPGWPRCSCRITKSVTSFARHASTMSLITWPPRLIRCELGNTKRIS